MAEEAILLAIANPGEKAVWLLYELKRRIGNRGRIVERQECRYPEGWVGIQGLDRGEINQLLDTIDADWEREVEWDRTLPQETVAGVIEHRAAENRIDHAHPPLEMPDNVVSLTGRRPRHRRRGDH